MQRWRGLKPLNEYYDGDVNQPDEVEDMDEVKSDWDGGGLRDAFDSLPFAVTSG